jgi:hypothetical protein
VSAPRGTVGVRHLRKTVEEVRADVAMLVLIKDNAELHLRNEVARMAPDQFDVRTLSTDQLEAWLRRPDLTSQQRGPIEAELERRNAAEIGGGAAHRAGSSGPPLVPRPPGGPSGAAPSPRPIPAMPSRQRSSSGLRVGRLRVVAAVIVGGFAALLIAVLNTGSSGGSGGSSDVACHVNGGRGASCPTALPSDPRAFATTATASAMEPWADHSPVVTDRIERAVREQFAAGEVPAVLELLGALRLPFLENNPEETERVQAAVVLLARGSHDRLLDAAALAEEDWRDVLVAAGLADEDWPGRLQEEFGP